MERWHWNRPPPTSLLPRPLSIVCWPPNWPLCPGHPFPPLIKGGRAISVHVVNKSRSQNKTHPPLPSIHISYPVLGKIAENSGKFRKILLEKSSKLTHKPTSGRRNSNRKWFEGQPMSMLSSHRYPPTPSMRMDYSILYQSKKKKHNQIIKLNWKKNNEM